MSKRGVLLNPKNTGLPLDLPLPGMGFCDPGMGFCDPGMGVKRKMEVNYINFDPAGRNAQGDR